MAELNSIVEEFQTHAGQPWTKKLMEVIALKDEEIRKAKDDGKKQTSLYLNMEEQRNNLRNKLDAKSVELTAEIGKLKANIEKIKSKK